MCVYLGFYGVFCVCVRVCVYAQGTVCMQAYVWGCMCIYADFCVCARVQACECMCESMGGGQREIKREERADLCVCVCVCVSVQVLFTLRPINVHLVFRLPSIWFQDAKTNGVFFSFFLSVFLC